MSDVKGIEIHDVLGLSDPATKLIETVASALGKWREPKRIVKMAKAKAEEIQIISEAIGNNLSLPTEYSDGKIAINAQDYEELAKRAGNRLFYQEMRKQQNIETIVDLASDELEKEESVSSEPVDPDWTMRFFNSVEDVSDEEMQKIWGRVLAGEVRQPKSFSMRTLEKLKNISQAEALLFKKLLSCCFFCKKIALLPKINKLLFKHGFSLTDVLTLEDCGLIQASSGINLNVSPKNTQNAHIHNRNILGTISFKSETKNKTVIPARRLTDSGSELLRITDVSFNDEYFIDFLKEFKLSNKHINITAHKILSFSDNNFTYSPEDKYPLD